MEVHPNTVKFNHNFLIQEDDIERAGLTALMQKLPGYDTLNFKYDKIFFVDGMRLLYPIVLRVGHAKGLLFACPDGNVIRETMNPYEPSTFWTREDILAKKLAPYSETPAPFDHCPILRDGLRTPMSPETQALLRYYISLRALDTDLTKYRLEFANVKHLKRALKLLEPDAVELADPCMCECTAGLEATTGSDLPVEVPSEGAQYALTAHLEQERMESTSVVPTDSDPSQSDGTDQGSPTTSYKSESDSVDQHQGDSAYPSSIFMYRSHSQSVIEKGIRDLNTLLTRKAAVKSRVEARRRLADYKDFEALKVMQLGPHRKADVENCMHEAKEIRNLARLDELEAEMIDRAFATAMGGTVPNETPKQSNIDHLTRDGVKGLSQEEQESRLNRGFTHG
jgi:hypothetical protein